MPLSQVKAILVAQIVKGKIDIQSTPLSEIRQITQKLVGYKLKNDDIRQLLSDIHVEKQCQEFEDLVESRDLPLNLFN